MFDILSPAEWDALRNWLGTIGGVVALLIASSTYRRNVRIKREEQARLVYSKATHQNFHTPGTFFELLPNDARIGSGSPGYEIVVQVDKNGQQKAMGHALLPIIQVTAVIHNGSKELIGPARIQMVDKGFKRTWDEFSIKVGDVAPESDYVVNFTWINEHHPGQPALGTTVIFRDASAEWWRRHLTEPIEQVHNDPENSGPTPTERVGIRAQQIVMGVDPMEEHKVTWRVHWNRFRRKCRGKSPLP